MKRLALLSILVLACTTPPTSPRPAPVPPEAFALAEDAGPPGFDMAVGEYVALASRPSAMHVSAQPLAIRVLPNLFLRPATWTADAGAPLACLVVCFDAARQVAWCCEDVPTPEGR